MTPQIREILHGAASGVPVSLTTTAGVQAGEVLVCIHAIDTHTAAQMAPPTGTPGLWMLQATGDIGDGDSHIRVWTRAASSPGIQVVTVAPVTDEDCFGVLYTLSDADVPDPSDDAAGTGSVIGTSNHAAPSVSPSTVDALLICASVSEVFKLGDYTAPDGMILRTEDDNVCTLATASRALAATGPTGPKIFQFSASVKYAAVSIAIRGAAGVLTGPAAPRISESGYAARDVSTSEVGRVLATSLAGWG